MKLPPLSFTLRDRAHAIEYVVYAYREITRQELLQAVAAYRSTPAGTTIKRGQRVQIITSLGHAE